MRLLFATSNSHKTAEIKKALPDNFAILSLKDIDLSGAEVDEPYHTLEENAIHKAISYRQLSSTDCFAEDTGLEVESLDGKPGVLSARYAGEPANDKNNIDKLLSALRDKTNRKAKFRTVIALIFENNQYVFEGICEGMILEKPAGENGFGYDPIFIPEGAHKSFAEMTMEEKNTYSHRKKALSKMIAFLHKNHAGI